MLRVNFSFLQPLLVLKELSKLIEICAKFSLPEGLEGVLRLALLVDESVEGLDVEVGLLGVPVKGPNEEGGAQTQQLVPRYGHYHVSK